MIRHPSHRVVVSGLLAAAVTITAVVPDAAGATPPTAQPSPAAPIIGASVPPEAVQRLPDQPNVVLITADDMRPDDLKAMPYTRTLVARKGVTFTDAISPNNLCCPARAEIVSGQYSQSSGVQGNRWPNGGYWSQRHPRETLPVWLQRAGYETGFVGKYMNGYGSEPPKAITDQNPARHRDEVPRGWTRWWASVGGIYEYTWATLLRKTPERPTPMRVRYDRYQTELFADITGNMIENFHETDDPFFIWYSSATPHGRVKTDSTLPIAQPKYRDLYKGSVPDDRRWAERFNENTADKTGKMHDLPAKERDRVLRSHRARLRSLRSLDDAVRSIVADLDAQNELADTVIIFTSDNGFALGEHRVTGKNLPYEAMLKVPMIVRSPDLRANYAPDAPAGSIVRSDLTVTTLDIPTTIVSLADAPTPWKMEGVNMMRPGLNPDHGAGDRGVILEAGPDTATRSDVELFSGVRTDRWTYFGWDGAPVRKANGSAVVRFNARNRFTREQGWIELYDRVQHPWQNTNRFSAHPTVREKLKAMLNAKFQCTGRACVFDARPFLD